jgi:hypothetical protein
MNRSPGHGAEAAKIRAQEEVRTQDDQDRRGLSDGEGWIQEALETAAAVVPSVIGTLSNPAAPFAPGRRG